MPDYTDRLTGVGRHGGLSGKIRGSHGRVARVVVVGRQVGSVGWSLMWVTGCSPAWIVRAGRQHGSIEFLFASGMSAVAVEGLLFFWS